jgi:sugar lactone lactonase YvrE
VTSSFLASSDVRVALPARDHLGEGPHWDAVRGELVRVDITHGLVHRWRPGTGASSVAAFEGEVSAALPRRGGGLVVAAGRTILLVDEDGRRRTVASVEPDRPDNRFNDCRCDPQGRLWAGTMSKLREPAAAALYRLEPDGDIERMVAATTLSNGMGWSPDGSLYYFIDSVAQRIDVFDFDGRDGTVHNRRPFAAIEPDDGLPDGLCVDAQGGIWVCLFGGGAVRRYAPDGQLDASIALPVSNPTCPAFGGPDLATLYLTTARHRLSPDQLAREPLAGSVLALEPGIAGLPAHPFAG